MIFVEKLEQVVSRSGGEVKRGRKFTSKPHNFTSKLFNWVNVLQMVVRVASLAAILLIQSSEIRSKVRYVLITTSGRYHVSNLLCVCSKEAVINICDASRVSSTINFVFHKNINLMWPYTIFLRRTTLFQMCRHTPPPL